MFRGDTIHTAQPGATRRPPGGTMHSTIPTLKFSHMEPISSAREDGGEMAVYVDKPGTNDREIVAVITKHMDEDSWGGRWYVSCYEVYFWNILDHAVGSRDFCTEDYPSARAALTAAKAWIKEVYDDFSSCLVSAEV